MDGGAWWATFRGVAKSPDTAGHFTQLLGSWGKSGNLCVLVSEAGLPARSAVTEDGAGCLGSPPEEKVPERALEGPARLSP